MKPIKVIKAAPGIMKMTLEAPDGSLVTQMIVTRRGNLPTRVQREGIVGKPVRQQKKFEIWQD